MKPQVDPGLEGLTTGGKDALRAFEVLLRDRAVPIGLIGERDPGTIWERHILDSLRAVRCLWTTDHVLVDVGTGAGLPGIPLAIARPDLVVVLLESKERRVAFLELAVDRIGVPNARVVRGRAPEVDLGPVDVATSRALARSGEAWSLVEPILREGGRLLYFAGSSWPGKDDPLGLPGLSVEVCSPARFPWQGPVVMMRRSVPASS